MSWEEKPLHLKDVPALRDIKTGKLWFRPSDIATAEIAELAKQHNLEPRDVSLLLALKAQPGGFFNKEEVQYQYHINKILFYQWKMMEKVGLGEAYPHDEFVKADRGPIPTNIDKDLKRLEKLGFVSTKMTKWGPRSTDESRHISLTKKGSEITHNWISKIPTPLLTTTTKAKTLIFPLTPPSVREMVHREYPEFKTGYTKDDLA